MVCWHLRDQSVLALLLSAFRGKGTHTRAGCFACSGAKLLPSCCKLSWPLTMKSGGRGSVQVPEHVAAVVEVSLQRLGAYCRDWEHIAETGSIRHVP